MRRYDLDLQLMLNVDEEDPDSFTAVRQQCLNDLRSKLCGKPRKGTDPEKVAKSGWQAKEMGHWLLLRHDKLGFELDVQVCATAVSGTALVNCTGHVHCHHH
jgi:hypothetical protein